MPIQAPQWTEFLSCPVCRHSFTRNVRPPISLGCGHTICQQCLSTLQRSQCPFDQTHFRTEPENLPINYALLQLVLPSGNQGYDGQSSSSSNTSATTTSSGSAGVEGSNSGGSGGGETNNNNRVTNNNNNNNNGGNLSASVKRDQSQGDLSSSSSSSAAEIVPLSVQLLANDEYEHYATAKECIEALALYLKPSPPPQQSNNNNNNGNANPSSSASSCTSSGNNLLTRQMQRKVVALICCQLFEDEGRSRAVRAARLLGERAVTELILHHQNPQQLSANLWAAVRARGCQFLGPAMQEEVLKLVLLALEDGSALSRKVLVMFVVQRLEPVYSQASKTSIGHVVQLLYRASCFKVSKREGDSSLMQLKEEFRTYEALRREHDTQIVQIATEAGLRIAPDQWSSLLYGDTTHKSHMQSINDKLQTPESFSQSVQELVLALQRTSDPAHLSNLQPCLKYLADIDPNAAEQSVPTWQQVGQACSAVRKVVTGLADFVQHHGNRKLQEITNANPAPKYKVNMCWIYTQRGSCPRGNKCNFAHSEAELNQSKARHNNRQGTMPPGQSQGQSPSMLSKEDFFMGGGAGLDPFGGPGGVKKPGQMGHNNMQSVETSPMRYPGSPAGNNPGMNVKGGMSPLPPQQSNNNNLLLPPQQQYNGGSDMQQQMQQMQMGGSIPPPPNHHGGPPHHHPGHHQHNQQGHSPLHVPTGPYSGPPQQPQSSLHPYHNAGGGGGHFNSMLPPTPNQLSPLGKFGFDPTKFNPNIRVSPNLGGQQVGGGPMPPPPPPLPVMPPQHPGRSPGRNFPNHNLNNNNNNNNNINKGGVGVGFNQNHLYMNDMSMGQPGQPNPMGPNMVTNNNLNKDYLNVQQQQQQQVKSGHPSSVGGSSFYWRKPMQPNQMQSPTSPQQQQQQMMQQNKSPSHLVGQQQQQQQMVGNKGGHPQQGPMGAMNKYPVGASLNDMIMSPRQQQPLKNSPTFFGKEDLPYWSMGQQSQQANQQHPHHPQQQSNGDVLQRNHPMMGNNNIPPHMPHHLYGGGPEQQPPTGHPLSSREASRRMFDRSDSILAGEDAPFEGNATTSKFGPIQRKASNSLGTGDTLKSSLGGLDLRHQAWLNSSQVAGSSSQTSPRMSQSVPMHQVPIGTEKKLSPAKEMGLVGNSGNHQHLTLSNEPLIVTSADSLVGSAGLWSPLDGSGGNGGNGGSSGSALNQGTGNNARYVWNTDKPYSVSAIGSCRSNSSLNHNNSKLLHLDMMEDDEKDIENGMMEISKKLATELVDDDFAT